MLRQLQKLVPQMGFLCLSAPTFSSVEGSPVSLVTTTASLAWKVALRCYKSFSSLLPRVSSYSCKGPQVCINWSHVKVQFSRSTSFVSAVTAAQIVQHKCVSHCQPHLTIMWQSPTIMARRTVCHMCHGHHQKGALGTELLKDGQPKEVQLTLSHTQLVPGGQTGLVLLTSCWTGMANRKVNQQLVLCLFNRWI